MVPNTRHTRSQTSIKAAWVRLDFISHLPASAAELGSRVGWLTQYNFPRAFIMIPQHTLSQRFLETSQAHSSTSQNHRPPFLTISSQQAVLVAANIGSITKRQGLMYTSQLSFTNALISQDVVQAKWRYRLCYGLLIPTSSAGPDHAQRCASKTAWIAEMS